MQTECLHLCPLQDAHSLGWPQSCFISLNAPKICETTSEGNCRNIFPLLREKERETQEPVPSKANGKKKIQNNCQLQNSATQILLEFLPLLRSWNQYFSPTAIC